MDSLRQTDDVRIKGLRTLISPAVLIEEIPVSEPAAALIAETRSVAEQIVAGEDDRIIVVVGPCSIHDPGAAVEYARLLLEAKTRHADDLLIIMRVYFEKPRTTVGWKGLINDPDINGSFDINRGLHIARGLLSKLNDLGVPVGCEFLDTISPQYVADFVSWGAIGARTTESQVHRELASGLSMPVGFKNGTAGSVGIAIDAIHAASEPHHFLSVTKQGTSAIVETEGNPYCHLILRGSGDGPNHDEASIADAAERLRDRGMRQRIMVDCSHGNSRKDHRNQPGVASNVAQQISDGSSDIAGVMLESFINEGNQKTPKKYGVSITDACIAWDTTVTVLDELAQAVRARRDRLRSA
ncbi:MAG: 3-deoxy-7-phosphoheptulonate synthase [Gammaproteobacteria bacterium]|nr:3-deoxy-7-phosphoheptulonate synthase [Gammaproteobacteria bacterium]NND53790.1 3-deoxy-7-phosphoheptulonate synthase [Gammaproteobacteria bacterium]